MRYILEDKYICEKCGKVGDEIEMTVVCTGVQNEDQIICDKCLRKEAK